MAGVEKMLLGVAKKLMPSKKERDEIKRQIEFAKARLMRAVPKEVDIRVMGSVAKGTNLADNREIDIFLLIPRKYTLSQMTSLGMAWAKKAMRGQKTQIGYAQHPYLKVLRGKYKIDIVPAYLIEDSSHINSAVDRSQLHTVYINSRMEEWQKGQVRLLKKFAKSLGVYGAELKVEGFSGYLCELLVLKYGSFVKVLEAASKWGKKPVIDIEGLRDGENLHEIFDAPLIVIDPVDRKRNVAAVVSQTSLSRFIYAAGQFLAKPSLKFFFGSKILHSKAKLEKIIRKRGSEIIVLHFQSPKLVEDILWPQLKKTTHMLERELKRGEFRPFGHYFWAGNGRALIMFELMEGKLPSLRKCIGPAIWHAKDVKAFVKKHKKAANTHFEHERIVALEERKFTDAKALLKDALKRGKKLGIPKKIRNVMKKAKLLGWESLLKKPYLDVAGDYFTRKV